MSGRGLKGLTPSREIRNVGSVVEEPNDPGKETDLRRRCRVSEFYREGGRKLSTDVT